MIYLLQQELIQERKLMHQLQTKHSTFFHLSFNSTLQLINVISSDLQKLLKYFIDTAIVAFFRIPLAALSV